MSCITFASMTGLGGGGGIGGGSGRSGGDGQGGWGGGDGGALPGSGGAPASNVLGDVALNEAPDMVEEVILIDVGGKRRYSGLHALPRAPVAKCYADQCAG